LSWSSSPFLPPSSMPLSHHSASLFSSSYPLHLSFSFGCTRPNQGFQSHRPPAQLEQRLRASLPATGKGHWRSGGLGSTFHEPDTLFFRDRKIIYRAYGPAPPPFMLCDSRVARPFASGLSFYLASLGAMKPTTAFAKARQGRVCNGAWMSTYICFYAPSRRGIADTSSSWFYHPQGRV